MARRFNPLDPLGLFERKESPGTSPTIREAMGKVWPPPDPLGIFERSHRGGGTIGNPIPIEFNGRLVDIKNQARQVLIGKGYPPQQVDMALKWAEEWLMGMARRMAPGNMELQRTVVQSAYAEIASRAEKWLQGIQAAFAIGGSVR